MIRGRIYWWLIALASAAVLPAVALAVMSALAKRPSGLGMVDGKFAECPSKPNCVSTQSSTVQCEIDPIEFSGAATDAMRELKSVISSMPGSRLVGETDNYMHVEFVSSFFRFVDDVEFYIDGESQTIQFRSASRVGYSDLGVNRKRMETVRRLFHDRQASDQER